LSYFFNLLGVWLDPLHAERGNSLDRPLDLMLPAPQGAGASEKNVRVHRIERPVRHGGPHVRGADDARRGREATERYRLRDELAPVDPAISNTVEHWRLLLLSVVAPIVYAAEYVGRVLLNLVPVILIRQPY